MVSGQSSGRGAVTRVTHVSASSDGSRRRIPEGSTDTRIPVLRRTAAVSQLSFPRVPGFSPFVPQPGRGGPANVAAPDETPWTCGAAAVGAARTSPGARVGDAAGRRGFFLPGRRRAFFWVG